MTCSKTTEPAKKKTTEPSSNYLVVNHPVVRLVTPLPRRGGETAAGERLRGGKGLWQADGEMPRRDSDVVGEMPRQRILQQTV